MPDNKKAYEEPLKPGSSATLKGAVGEHVYGLLSLAFAVVPLAMAQQATMELNQKMTPGIKQSMASPKASTPNPFEMKMPTLEMKR